MVSGVTLLFMLYGFFAIAKGVFSRRLQWKNVAFSCIHYVFWLLLLTLVFAITAWVLMLLAGYLAAVTPINTSSISGCSLVAMLFLVGSLIAAGATSWLWEKTMTQKQPSDH
jgi:hypothetical protein